MKPGTESMVSMQVVGYSTTQEALGHFNPQERDCYTDEEFQPLYFNKVITIILSTILYIICRALGSDMKCLTACTQVLYRR